MMDQRSRRLSDLPHDLDQIMTPEEVAILKECNREAMVKRGIPWGSVLAAGTYFALKTGFLKPSANYGYIPAVGIAGIIGCIAGSFSYKAACIQKVLALPNSTLKQRFDASRKKYARDRATSKEPPLPEQPYIQPQSETFSGLQSETYQPSNDFDGFSGVHTDGDQPSTFNLLEPLDKFGGAPTTYDELRRQNREEYKRLQTTRLPPPRAGDTQFAQPQAPISEGIQSFDRDRVPQYQLVD